MSLGYVHCRPIPTFLRTIVCPMTIVNYQNSLVSQGLLKKYKYLSGITTFVQNHRSESYIGPKYNIYVVMQNLQRP